MASTSACHAPTPPPRTIRLSTSSVPLTTLCAPFCSRLPFRHPTGSKPCRQPLTCLTFCPPKRYNLGRRTLPFSALHPPMITSAYLVANVTLTCLPPLPIGCPLGLPYVFLDYSTHHKGYRCLYLSSNSYHLPARCFRRVGPLPSVVPLPHRQNLIS